MGKKKIFVIGSGGHASACIDLIESTNKFEIIGIFSDDKKIKRKFSYAVIGTTQDISKYKKTTINLVLGFGSIYNLKKRHDLYVKLKKAGFKFPILISKNSYISNRAKILEGSQIFHNCTVNSGSIISENCILNNNSLLDHDCEISKNVHISTGVTLNGTVKISKNTFVGSGSVIKDNIKIRSNSFIKMGSIIKNDI